MSDTLRPDNPEQLLEAIQWAAAEGEALEIRGLASKLGLGRPLETPHRLAVDGISGITLYEPEELVLTARAGTSMAEIEAALAEHHQRLAFEPPDWRRLLGSGAGGSNTGGTLGGVIACNLSGPRRMMVGAARDHLLGFHAVSGRGETFKSGGRVVKNVTGFDLSKLIAGSYGTLAVMTEVTVRALPAPDETRTIVLRGCGEDAAITAMAAALKSSHEVSGAAHLPSDVALLSRIGAVAETGEAVTAIRVEGPAPSVAFRCDALRALLAPYGRSDVLNNADSLALWREIRDVSYFVEPGERVVWRLSAPPSEGARIAAEILFETEGQVYYDWGGGLLWLALAPSADAAHETVRRAVAGSGGHATLIRAEDEIRRAVPVFQPQPAPLAALTRRIKEAFDPLRVLNPGLMGEGV